LVFGAIGRLLAVADRADQATGVDAVLGQVVVHGGGATLRQLLVVSVGTLRVGVTGNFNAQIRVTLQDLGGFAQDRHGVRTQVRLVEVEVDALQVDGDRHRATVRTDGLTRLRVRALVVAVVDAVTVVIQVGAARGNRSRSRSSRDRSRPSGITTPTEASTSPNQLFAAAMLWSSKSAR
jgi:hypothetical protein